MSSAIHQTGAPASFESLRRTQEWAAGLPANFIDLDRHQLSVLYYGHGEAEPIIIGGVHGDEKGASETSAKLRAEVERLASLKHHERDPAFHRLRVVEANPLAAMEGKRGMDDGNLLFAYNATCKVLHEYRMGARSARHIAVMEFVTNQLDPGIIDNELLCGYSHTTLQRDFRDHAAKHTGLTYDAWRALMVRAWLSQEYQEAYEDFLTECEQATQFGVRPVWRAPLIVEIHSTVSDIAHIVVADDTTARMFGIAAHVAQAIGPDTPIMASPRRALRAFNFGYWMQIEMAAPDASGAQQLPLGDLETWRKILRKVRHRSLYDLSIVDARPPAQPPRFYKWLGYCVEGAILNTAGVEGGALSPEDVEHFREQGYDLLISMSPSSPGFEVFKASDPFSALGCPDLPITLARNGYLRRG